MKSSKISQEMIARDLGVSQALVSLVLNGKRENISDDSYKRIWNYAIEKGYRPKGMQANGNHLATRNIGFILRAGLRLHTQSNFFSQVQHGLHTGLLAHGYHTVFLGSEDDLTIQTVQKKLKENQLFGVAIFGQVDEKFMRAIKAVQNNLVAISFSYPGLCHSVMPNDNQAVQLLVNHLTSLGHKRFAWIGGDKMLHYNFRRRAALVQSLEQHGLKLEEKYNVNTDGGDRMDGWKAVGIMHERISRQRYPTAWVCGNGQVARGAINCLLQKDWKIPEQISMVAIDATRVCEEEYPKITGAHSDPQKIGMKAAELLLQTASQPDGALADVIMAADLTVRESTAKVNPAGVAKAALASRTVPVV